VFDVYARDFATLVNTTYEISNGGYMRSLSGYKRTLARAVREIMNGEERRRRILKEDIEQELALMWVEFEQDYLERKPSVSRRRYLIWRSIWGLKDWLRKELKMQLQQHDLIAPDIFFPPEPKQKIDVEFLVRGSKNYPFSLLSPYERYLLFLRFYKDMDLGDMADLMQKSRPTVRKLLTKVIQKLRRQEWNSQRIPKKTM
jgi:hypothetical protein